MILKTLSRRINRLLLLGQRSVRSDDMSLQVAIGEYRKQMLKSQIRPSLACHFLFFLWVAGQRLVHELYIKQHPPFGLIVDFTILGQGVGHHMKG